MNAESLLPWAAFVWGLFGGFTHCIGMCGVFVFAYSGSVAAGGALPIRGQLARHLLFNIGHLVTVMFLGAVAGFLGTLPRFAQHWRGIQGWASLVAGVLMILLALGYLGAMPKWRVPELNVMGSSGPLRSLFISAMRTHHPLKPLLLGLLIGFLPCHLIYQVLIPAALTGSVLKGIGLMAAFGIGLMPGLITLGFFSGLATLRFRNLMVRLASVPVLVMGLLFIQRGLPHIGLFS